MRRQQKEQVVGELRDALSRVEAVLITEFKGVDVPSMVELRRELRATGAHYRVVKNTLVRRAIEGTDLAFLEEHLRGPTALAWTDTDPVAVAKVLKKFSKDHEGLRVRAGSLQGKPLTPEQVEALASLPGLDELRSMFLSVLMGPARKLVTLLGQAQRNFLLVLGERGKALEGAEQ